MRYLENQVDALVRHVNFEVVNQLFKLSFIERPLVIRVHLFELFHNVVDQVIGLEQMRMVKLSHDNAKLPLMTQKTEIKGIQNS